MSRPLDGRTTTALAGDITRPLYLVEFGFTTPVRYSSRDTTTALTYTWTAASFDIIHGDRPTVQVFNANTTFGDLVLSEGVAGKTIKIYQAIEDGSGYTDPEQIFDGEMGEATITEVVSISCRMTPPLRSPRLYAVPPYFNHAPAPGTRIETPKGIIILGEP